MEALPLSGRRRMVSELRTLQALRQPRLVNRLWWGQAVPIGTTATANTNEF